MTRFQKFVGIEPAHIDYPEDVEKIRQSCSMLRTLPDLVIQRMWEEFSDSYSAGWLIVDDDFIESFRGWLWEEVVE